MWNLVLVLLVSALALAAVLRLRRADAALAAPKPARRVAASRSGPPPPNGAATLGVVPWGAPVPAPAALAGEALRNRIRDRYIAARFPGLLAGSEDLGRVDHVIQCARLFFEEEKCDLAHELLTLAIARHPADEALRLAQLEIAFLLRERDRFVRLATAFRLAVPESRNGAEISRLGRAMAPDEPMFAAGPGSRPHEHYGPWPDLPNWIQASWDLTGEVLAADFRRAMLRDRPAAKPDLDFLGACRT
jgi:hypothetical protein